MGRIGSEIDHMRADPLGGVPHGFLGRGGGVSTGIYAGLNVGLGSGDDIDHVLENRRRAVAAVLPGAELVTIHQEHSADAVKIDGPIGIENRPRADAMVTRAPGLLLGVLTADCVPVLLADSEAGVVGAVHAGWKGALAGVSDNAIAAMVELGADKGRIGAAIGPCIAQRSYEVDADFRDNYVDQDPKSGQFFAQGRPEHYQFDIEGYVEHRLRRAGIGHVAVLGQDSYADEARFFSYRRATHRGEPDYGRQISLIGVGAA